MVNERRVVNGNDDDDSGGKQRWEKAPSNTTTEMNQPMANI